MKVVVINLFNAQQRANHINSQLNRQGIVHSFFRGLNNNKFKLISKGNMFQSGLIGCYISHLLAWQNHAVNDNYVIFLEDDYILPENFISQIQEAITSLPSDADFAFLFWNKIGNGSSYQEIPINHTWKRCNGVWSTVAYLVKTNSVNKLTEVLGDKVHGHIDIVVADKGWKGELNVYFLNNPIGGLAGLKSQIAL